MTNQVVKDVKIEIGNREFLTDLVVLLASKNCSMAYCHGLCDFASHPTVSTVEWGSLFGRSIPDKA